MQFVPYFIKVVNDSNTLLNISHYKDDFYEIKNTLYKHDDKRNPDRLCARTNFAVNHDNKDKPKLVIGYLSFFVREVVDLGIKTWRKYPSYPAASSGNEDKLELTYTDVFVNKVGILPDLETLNLKDDQDPEPIKPETILYKLDMVMMDDQTALFLDGLSWAVVFDIPDDKKHLPTIKSILVMLNDASFLDIFWEKRKDWKTIMDNLTQIENAQKKVVAEKLKILNHKDDAK